MTYLFFFSFNNPTKVAISFGFPLIPHPFAAFGVLRFGNEFLRRLRADRVVKQSEVSHNPCFGE